MANERLDDDVKYNPGQCKEKKKGKSIQQELLLAQLQVDQYVKIFIMVEEEKKRKAGE